MKLRSVLISTLGVAALAQFPSPASAVSLINENFNTVPQGFYSTSSTVGSFTVTSGSVDVVGTGSNDYYPGNGNYVDLNGLNPGTLTSIQSFNINPGGTLSFNYGENLDGGTYTPTADVFLGATKLGTVSGAPALQTFNYKFTSSASGALQFVATSGGSYGVILDNVALDSPATAVPEPSEIPGMLLFAGGALMLRRKYLAKKA